MGKLQANLMSITKKLKSKLSVKMVVHGSETSHTEG